MKFNTYNKSFDIQFNHKSDQIYDIGLAKIINTITPIIIDTIFENNKIFLIRNFFNGLELNILPNDKLKITYNNNYCLFYIDELDMLYCDEYNLNYLTIQKQITNNIKIYINSSIETIKYKPLTNNTNNTIFYAYDINELLLYYSIDIYDGIKITPNIKNYILDNFDTCKKLLLKENINTIIDSFEEYFSKMSNFKSIVQFLLLHPNIYYFSVPVNLNIITTFNYSFDNDLTIKKNISINSKFIECGYKLLNDIYKFINDINSLINKNININDIDNILNISIVDKFINQNIIDTDDCYGLCEFGKIFLYSLKYQIQNIKNITDLTMIKRVIDINYKYYTNINNRLMSGDIFYINIFCSYFTNILTIKKEVIDFMTDSTNNLLGETLTQIKRNSIISFFKVLYRILDSYDGYIFIDIINELKLIISFINDHDQQHIIMITNDNIFKTYTLITSKLNPLNSNGIKYDQYLPIDHIPSLTYKQLKMLDIELLKNLTLEQKNKFTSEQKDMIKSFHNLII